MMALPLSANRMHSAPTSPAGEMVSKWTWWFLPSKRVLQEITRFVRGIVHPQRPVVFDLSRRRGSERLRAVVVAPRASAVRRRRNFAGFTEARKGMVAAAWAAGPTDRPKAGKARSVETGRGGARCRLPASRLAVTLRDVFQTELFTRLSFFHELEKFIFCRHSFSRRHGDRLRR